LTSVCMLRRFIPTATRFIALQPRTPLFRQFVTSSSISIPLNSNKLSVPKPTPNKMSAPEQGGSAVNLHPDPVTGEMISKSELKKREKQRAKDAARAEKKAAAPAPAAGEKKEKSEKDNEEELDAGVSAQELCLCNRSFRIFSPSIICSNTLPSDARRSWHCESPSLRTRTLTSSMSPSPFPALSRNSERRVSSRMENDSPARW
jgi:hypothetical protein